jgi:hypothetical protein
MVAAPTWMLEGRTFASATSAARASTQFVAGCVRPPQNNGDGASERCVMLAALTPQPDYSEQCWPLSRLAHSRELGRRLGGASSNSVCWRLCAGAQTISSRSTRACFRRNRPRGRGGLGTLNRKQSAAVSELTPRRYLAPAR